MNAGAGDPLRVVMIGSRLPSRSETFVYRELLALRALGVDIRPASVRTPDASDLAPEARALAAEAIPIYGNGRGWWLGVLLALVWPAAWRVFWRAHRDAWRRMPRARADAMEAADPPAPAGPLTMRDRVALFTQAAGAVALAWRVRGFRPQLIHAHLAHVPCTIAMYTAEALRVPFAFTGHAAGLFRDGRLLDLKAARAAFVGCISAWHRDWMVRAFGVDTAKLPIIRCGVDVDEAKTRASGEPASAGGACPGSAPPAEAVSPGHAQARPFRIVTVGRLVPKKGLDLLIAAFARCLEHGSLPAASELVIVGDGPERDRLAALAAELGIAERLAWRGGLPHAEALGAIRSGDVFALLARPAADGDRDGVPVVLMEAMAAGVPVIAGGLPAIRELVRDGETGFIVDTGSASTLVGPGGDRGGAGEAEAAIGATSRLLNRIYREVCEASPPNSDTRIPPMATPDNPDAGSPAEPDSLAGVAERARLWVATEFATPTNACRWRDAAAAAIRCGR